MSEPIQSNSDGKALDRAHLVELYELLIARFNKGELRGLCFELGIEYDDLPGAGRGNRARELVRYSDRHQRTDELIVICRRLRPGADWDKCLPEEPIQEFPHLPFTNREDDLDRILSSFAPPYFMLDAPAGYGKTELLKQLKQRFEEQEWVCAHVSVDEFETLQSLVNKLAQGFDLSPVSDPDVERLGRKFAGALKQMGTEKIGHGVALLIDLGIKPPLLTIEDLLDKFIPEVHKSLQGLTEFSTQQNRFRVVLAGRYIARQIKARSTPLAIRKLTPFDYQVVQDTTRKYLSKYGNHNKVWLSDLAAHLMYLTGGHPGCMARVLEIYVLEGFPPPDSFLQDCSEEIWTQVVEPVSLSLAVRGGIPRHLRTSLDRLCVFRYLDYGILRWLISQDDALIQRYKDENEMADDLTTNYLLNWKGRLLQDDITRRMLAIRLRRGVGPDEFASRCAHAQSICAEYLQDTTTQMPEKWAIEYLYQTLQQHDGLVAQEREMARRALFGDNGTNEDGVLRQVLRWLVDGRDASVEKMALKQALEADWEFHFTVNYFLRQDEYSDEPYKELQQKINGFFSQTT